MNTCIVVCGGEKVLKHYVDIENIKFNETEFVRKNTGSFEIGDIISIQEKIDGSNASFTFSGIKDGKATLQAFSRKKELNFNNNLAGFWNWVQTLDANEYFSDDARYIYFGEWLRRNKIKYRDECMNKFYLFDIYNQVEENWLKPNEVKAQAEKHGLKYIHEFYYGPFISWEHCRSFMNSPQYGDTQEGIVVRNVTKMTDPANRSPTILKIVNEEFKERMKTKEINPEKEAERDRTNALIETIVTPRRVEKMIFALRDEGIIPDELTPKDMKLVAQNLPKRVFEDCVKEEKEVVESAGENAGKAISSLTMKIARGLILGG